uniref:Uncharacterized protein n=1 Tax=Timema bartmani TaxID=61472 RepID=A0A7R9I0T8_9NEOP|nr:unnamed protein product [Timema bartmani]
MTTFYTSHLSEQGFGKLVAPARVNEVVAKPLYKRISGTSWLACSTVGNVTSEWVGVSTGGSASLAFVYHGSSQCVVCGNQRQFKYTIGLYSLVSGQLTQTVSLTAYQISLYITRYLSETLKEEALSVHAENERATLVRRVTILFPDDSLLPVISRPYLDMNGRSQKQERLRKLLEEINAVDSNISELSDSDDGESDYCEENDHQSDSEQSDCDVSLPQNKAKYWTGHNNVS